MGWFDFGFGGLLVWVLGVDGFWVYVFIFLIGSVWIQIRGLGSRFGVVKVSELFFLFCLVAKKVWEIRNLKIGFGFGVWMFIIRGVENGYGGWRTKKKSKKWEKGKKRMRENLF